MEEITAEFVEQIPRQLVAQVDISKNIPYLEYEREMWFIIGNL